MNQLILLRGPATSGRGVKIRTLDLDERNETLATSAKELGGEATMLALRADVTKECVCKFVVAVTTKTDFKKVADLREKDVAWEEPTYEQLSTNHSKWFTPKDMSILSGIFSSLHDATEKEIENIMGEALPVAED